MAKSEIEKYQPGPKRPLIKASFDLEVAKKNYQVLLQNLAAISVTKDNVSQDLTKEGREILKAITEMKDEQSKDPLQMHRDIMSVYKELSAPIQEQVDRISAEKKVVATKMQEEQAVQTRELNRVNAAKQAIVDFANKVANMIGAAKTDDEVVAIEKLIGSEKTKKSVYQEFIGELAEKCDALRPAIKSQKENIRTFIKIVEDQQAAMSAGDIQTVTELEEKKEMAALVIQETGIRIHETAFEQSVTVDLVVPEVADVVPKGRTNWKWRVDDIQALRKKMPGMVKIVPDEEAIDNWLAIKKKDGSLKDKNMESVNGITFYNDQSFK